MTPIHTPNLYGGRLCGWRRFHSCTYRHQNGPRLSVTSLLYRRELGRSPELTPQSPYWT